MGQVSGPSDSFSTTPSPIVRLCCTSGFAEFSASLARFCGCLTKMPGAHRYLDYANVPLELSCQASKLVRRAIIYYAGLNYEKKGHLEFVHSVTGVCTLKQEFDKVVSHNEHHLSQIRLAPPWPGSLTRACSRRAGGARRSARAARSLARAGTKDCARAGTIARS